MRWWMLMAVLVCSLGSASTARAGEGSARAWGRGCLEARGFALTEERAIDGMVSFDVDPGALRLEVRPDSAQSFAHAGRYGVSPVGQFADWSAEPEERRRALEAVVACLTEDPTLALTPGSALPHRGALLDAGTPWILLGALLAFMGLGLSRGRPAMDWRAGGLGAALYLFAFGSRWALAPSAYFHQNGQGPLWVGYALGEPSPYGPGYHELFARVASSAGAAPDLALFRAQALLGALVAPLGWLLVRGAGARRPVALVTALLLALSPTLARGAQSESYYATSTSVLFLATTALVLGASRRGRWSLALGVLAAGLFVAVLARLHPVAWVPGALVALAPLSLEGGLRERLRRVVLAAVGMGSITALLSGKEMLGVLGGELGRQWGPAARAMAPSLGALIAPLVAAVVLALCAWRWPRLRPLVLPALVLGSTLRVMYGVSLVEGLLPYVVGAYRALYLPGVLLASVALLRAVAPTRRAGRWIALLAGGLGLALIAWRWPTQVYVATDAREQAWAMTWRGSLPPGSCVAYVDRAERRVLTLPLYDRCSREWTWTAGDPPSPALDRLGSAYYVHTSLCSTPEARAACRRFEEAHELALVTRATLPSLPSLPYAPLPQPSVEVSLWRIVGPRVTSTSR